MAFILAVAVLPVVNAQETTGGIKGYVKDKTGGAVAGAEVEISGPALLRPRKAEADSAGYFYCVMELADDVTTGQEIDPEHYTPRTLRSAASERGRMGFEDCVQIGLSLTQALGHMHNHGLIHRVAPRSFLYWVAVTAADGNNTFEITQTITTGNFHTFLTAIGNGSNVFDSDCVPLQRTITQNGHMVTLRFNAPAAGTYYIAIKFNTQNLIGEPAPSPTTVHYDLTTTGVPASTSGLDLVKY
jgi:hypothetical protein